MIPLNNTMLQQWSYMTEKNVCGHRCKFIWKLSKINLTSLSPAPIHCSHDENIFSCFSSLLPFQKKEELTSCEFKSPRSSRHPSKLLKCKKRKRCELSLFNDIFLFACIETFFGMLLTINNYGNKKGSKSFR